MAGEKKQMSNPTSNQLDDLVSCAIDRRLLGVAIDALGRTSYDPTDPEAINPSTLIVDGIHCLEQALVLILEEEVRLNNLVRQPLIQAESRLHEFVTMVGKKHPTLAFSLLHAEIEDFGPNMVIRCQSAFDFHTLFGAVDRIAHLLSEAIGSPARVKVLRENASPA